VTPILHDDLFDQHVRLTKSSSKACA
jgi:hypothetical protein